MGKLILIKGADFSSVALDKITPPMSTDELSNLIYIEYAADISNMTNALIDSDERLLYALYSDGTDYDTSDQLSDTYISGVSAVSLIKQYKSTL